VCSLFFHLDGGQHLHNVLTLILCILTENPSVHFVISSPMVSPKILPDVLLLPRCSCSVSVPYSTAAFWFCPMSLPECLSFLGFWYSLVLVLSLMTVSLTLCRNGMAVDHPWAAANFFWDPPLPWVYFGWPRQLTARCQSLYCSFSAPKVSTVASSLGTSSYSTSDSISSGFDSKSVACLS
jgi:hypothetical protein